MTDKQDIPTLRKDLKSWFADALPDVWGTNEDNKHIVDSEALTYEVRRRYDLRLHKDGWAGLGWPAEYGGRALSLVEQMVFFEEAVRAGAPEFFNRLGLGIIGPSIIEFGTAAQKDRYLHRILACEDIWCQGFSEPEAGSDLASLSCSAERVEGQWVIRGHKVWTTLAQFADKCFLLARTDSSGRKHEGITAFLLDMRQPAVTVRPLRQINGDSEFNEVLFDGAIVTDDDVLGAVGGGWGVAMRALDFERSTNFMLRQVRLVADVDELSATIRTYHDVLSPSLVDGTAECLIRSKALSYAIWRLVENLSWSGGSAGPSANAIKVFWSETNQRLTTLGDEVWAQLESLGLKRPDRDWGTDYFSARACTIYAGTTEIQKNIIAERALGLPR